MTEENFKLISERKKEERQHELNLKHIPMVKEDINNIKLKIENAGIEKVKYKKENEENTKRNSNSIKKNKFNDIGIFRKIVKDIKDINNKMLSSILAKNNKVYQLPNIKDRNKKEKIFCTENTNKPIIYKINSENKKYEI